MVLLIYTRSRRYVFLRLFLNIFKTRLNVYYVFSFDRKKKGLCKCVFVCVCVFVRFRQSATCDVMLKITIIITEGFRLSAATVSIPTDRRRLGGFCVHRGPQVSAAALNLRPRRCGPGGGPPERVENN